MSTTRIDPVAQRLKGKVALITGAASGIGLATAKLFHCHGAKVVIADIQDELGRQACREMSSDGSDDAMYFHCDVTIEQDVAGAIDGTVAKFGKLDIMYNNAGIIGPSCPSVPDIEKSMFERVLSVNVVGGFLGAKHAARVMIPARQGSIIFTASVASVKAGRSRHAYCTSKHAVAGLCKSMAVDLGEFGIRVNCVSPYAVLTPLFTGGNSVDESQFYTETNKHVFLKGMNLKPEDVAEAALYFASDDSKYISGHNLVIDGGFTIGSHLKPLNG
ncbi:secoisolariciresinol dehydrogenase-like isoform X2 [Nymphaea colorata]|nr:secoisolariciresinol dehydrogenase-like isoform X2 [Nymphaea colorata]